MFRALLIVLISDLIVSESGYGCPMELARSTAERIVDAPGRVWGWATGRTARRRVLERRVAWEAAHP